MATTNANVTIPYNQLQQLQANQSTGWGGVANAVGGLISGIGSTMIDNSATNAADSAISAGVASANQGVQNALTAASGYAQPYIEAGASQLGAYKNALANQGIDQQANIDKMNALYSPYTQAGSQAAGQQLGAINDLRNLGSAMDYYNKVRPMYAQNIEAGQNMLNPAQQNALATQRGFQYGDFENSGHYRALENANRQAQRQLAAQAGAQGMTGSGTMAAALGNRMQENYANYFGQAQQADLMTKQAAAQQFQALINQGLTAQQAANQVANQMMSNDVGKNQAVVSALGNVANMGISAQNSAMSNALNMGTQQLAGQAQQINSLYNAANMGNVTAQALMNNYLRGAELTGKNTLSGAAASGAGVLRNAQRQQQVLTSGLDKLVGLIGNDKVQSLIGKGFTTVMDWFKSGDPEAQQFFDDATGDRTGLTMFDGTRDADNLLYLNQLMSPRIYDTVPDFMQGQSLSITDPNNTQYYLNQNNDYGYDYEDEDWTR